MIDTARGLLQVHGELPDARVSVTSADHYTDRQKRFRAPCKQGEERNGWQRNSVLLRSVGSFQLEVAAPAILATR